MSNDVEVRALAAADPLADPALFRELSRRDLLWDPYFAGRRRVDLHPLVLSAAMHASAVRAAEGAALAITEVAALAHREADERARYGLGGDVHRLASASFHAGDDAAFARVDLLLDRDGTFRACEINADCPGGQNEAHGLPRLAREAGFAEGSDPTTVLLAMTERLRALADRPEAGAGRGAVGLTFATAYAEDLQIVALIQRALGEVSVRAVRGPPTAPRAHDDRGLTLGGVAVGALYRYFPVEYMEGQRNLDAIVGAVSRGEVRTFPSFAGIYAQSKLSFARAFARRNELSAAAQQAITDHLPETHDLADIPPATLLAERGDWVIKRALGRVGAQVFVGALHPEAAWATLVGQVVALRAAGEAYVAQRLVEQRAIPTPFGDRFVTLGAYVLDGHFCGYFARLTAVTHVAHDALCVPTFVLDR
jgi:hypothetical protein